MKVRYTSFEHLCEHLYEHLLRAPLRTVFRIAFVCQSAQAIRERLAGCMGVRAAGTVLVEGVRTDVRTDVPKGYRIGVFIYFNRRYI